MKVCIYSKENCGICNNAKSKMRLFDIKKVDNIKDWIDNTWIERDALKVIAGGVDDWRSFPDLDLLSFKSFENTDKVPLIWIDGNVYYYTEAMKLFKKYLKRKKNISIAEITTPKNKESDSVITLTA